MIQVIINKLNELIEKLTIGTISPDEGVALTEFISKLDIMERGLPQDTNVFELVALGSVVKSLLKTHSETESVKTV